MITDEFRRKALREWKSEHLAMVKRLQDAGSDITVVGMGKDDPGQTPSSGTMTFVINMTPRPSGKRRSV